MTKTDDRKNAQSEQVLKQVELQRLNFETDFKTFSLQIAFSSFANMLGQVAGHPLDTVKVSSLHVFC